MIGNFVFGASGISKESEKCAMKTPYVLMAEIILLIAAHPILAQHQHNSGPSAGSGFIPDSSDAVRDFQRSAAIQASGDQLVQLLSWAQRTAALNRQLADIGRVSKSRSSSGLSGEADTFKAALVTDNLDRNTFLVPLSAPQFLELRKPVRRLGRANDAMANAFSEITEGFGQTQDTKLLTNGLQRVKKAIATEQCEQQQFAREMGVTM